MKNKKQLWWVYLDGYRIVETKSIGYKWVRYRTRYWGNNPSRYTKIKRSTWDKAFICSLETMQQRKVA